MDTMTSDKSNAWFWPLLTILFRLIRAHLPTGGRQTILIGCITLLYSSGAVASSIVTPPPTITVEPGLPSVSDNVSITVSYGLPSSCFELSATHSVNGFDIEIDITETQSGDFCLFVVTQRSVTENLGTLPKGDYNVSVIANSQTIGSATFSVVEKSDLSLLKPVDNGSICTLAVFDWSDAIVPGATYEILVASDPGFNNIVASQAGLISSRTVIDNFPVSENQSLFWTVQVTAPSGGVTYSNAVHALTVNPAGGCLITFGNGADAIISGLVRSNIDLSLLMGATVTVQQQGQIPFTIDITDATGEFILDIAAFEQGEIVNLNISKDGFEDFVIQVQLESRTVIETTPVNLVATSNSITSISPDPAAIIMIITTILSGD